MRKAVGKTHVLYIRVPAATAERLDAARARIAAQIPGPVWSRSDILRVLLERALTVDEAGIGPSS